MLFVWFVEISTSFPPPIGNSVLLKFDSSYGLQQNIREVHFVEEANLSQYCQLKHLQAASPPVEVRDFILEALGRNKEQ